MGEIFTRSSPFSVAIRFASSLDTIPSCSPSSPISRTSLSMIASFSSCSAFAIFTHLHQVNSNKKTDAGHPYNNTNKPHLNTGAVLIHVNTRSTFKPLGEDGDAGLLSFYLVKYSSRHPSCQGLFPGIRDFFSGFRCIFRVFPGFFRLFPLQSEFYKAAGSQPGTAQGKILSSILHG